MTVCGLVPSKTMNCFGSGLSSVLVASYQTSTCTTSTDFGVSTSGMPGGASA